MSSIALDFPAWERRSSSTSCAEKCERHFQSLVKQYADRLYRYAYWLSGDPHIAEDLIQETYLRAWRSLDTLEDGNAVQSWLFTILRRENARRFERVQPEWSDEEVDQLEARIRSYDTSTEAFVLRRALAELPADYRDPLLLQIVAGYNYDEIAAQLHLSKSAVTSRLYRARQKLYSMLGVENE